MAIRHLLPNVVLSPTLSGFLGFMPLLWWAIWGRFYWVFELDRVGAMMVVIGIVIAGIATYGYVDPITRAATRDHEINKADKATKEKRIAYKRNMWTQHVRAGGMVGITGTVLWGFGDKLPLLIAAIIIGTGLVVTWLVARE